MENTSNPIETNGEHFNESKNDLLDFIPYLYKDLWEIGSTPAYKFELLKKNMLTTGKPNILDLGCGKGAELIQLQESFDFTGVGVDIIPQFIEEAEFRRGLNEVNDIDFIVDDFVANIDNYSDYDILLFSHTDDIFGDLCSTLNKLKYTLKPKGHIVLDSYIRKSGANSEYSSKFLKYKDTKTTFSDCGFDLKGYIFWNLDKVKRNNEFKTNVLTARCNELKVKHPDKKDLLDSFLNEQLEKMKYLETELDTITWLLKVK